MTQLALVAPDLEAALSVYADDFMRVASTVYPTLRVGPRGTYGAIAYQAFYFSNGEHAACGDVMPVVNLGVDARHRMAFGGNVVVMLGGRRATFWTATGKRAGGEVATLGVRDADWLFAVLLERGL